MNTELVKEIATLLSKCDYEEVSHVYKMLSSLRTQLDKHYRDLFKYGNVIVYKKLMGKVIRVNKKTITIRNASDGQEWRIPISLVIKEHRRIEREMEGVN